DEVIAELWEEREGILAWLVEGAVKYLSEGLKPPPEIIEATREYRDEMDSVGPFLEQCTETMPKPAGDIPPHRVSCRGLYDHYVNWCHWEGRRAWKENTFANAMSQKGFEKNRDNKGRWYLNLRMTTIP